MNENQNNTKSYNDLVKFGVLLLIMAGVILVVSLTRPLIFGRIVPAVLGSGQTTAPLPDAGEGDTLTVPPAEELPGYPAPDSANVPEASCCDAAAYPAPNASTTSTETVTPALEATNFVTHTLQPGENLTKLAQQYGITIEEIIQANNLQNPDSVQAGTALRIPIKAVP